ncbi:hypothetical protein [Kitasatospora cineracea]|uniref:hypothetical protein n=1 Tax=Kitasatospora cineracea TaxID=88074 RepID=UPI0034073C04
MAGTLASAVHLTHPDTGERHLLLPGDQVPPELADLITHPDALLPTLDEDDEVTDGTRTSDEDNPPAKPARARKASTDTE